MNIKQTLFIVVSIFLLFFGLVKIDFSRQIWNQDENDMASLAVGMLKSKQIWVRPTYHPVGQDDDQLGKGIVAPPLANAMMATPSLLGIREAWTFPLIQAILLISGMIFFTQKIARSSFMLAFAAVSVCITLSPRLMIDILILKPDVALAGFSVWAVALAFPLNQQNRLPIAILSGLFLGLAFLSKLWLIIPASFATLFLWLSYSNRWRLTTMFIVTALIVSFSHLFFIYITDPDSFSRWWYEVYFSIFSHQGVASTKWSGVVNHPEWSHNIMYYPFAIIREIGFAIPLATYGFFVALKGERREFVLALAWGLLVGLLIISVPKIKEPLYVLSIVSIGTIFGSYGLIAILENVRSYRLIFGCLAMSLVVCLLIKKPQITIPSDDTRQPLLLLGLNQPAIQSEVMKNE